MDRFLFAGPAMTLSQTPNGTDSIEGCFLSHCHILRFEAPALQDIVAAAQSTSNVNILLKIL
jgi:hypothetical protein